MTIVTTRLDSPIGPLRLAASDAGLVAIELPHARHRVVHAEWPAGQHPVLDAACRQLQAYFDGRLQHFDLPLAAHGTPFQVQVWQALQQVPHGRTTSYRALAIAIGRPTATRAVGAANGRNRLPIVIPCHRVIGSDGSLTGYAGGMAAKQFLLALEAA